MTGQIATLINQIAQNKIDFEIGSQALLSDPNYDFQATLILLRDFIYNSVCEKTSYMTETYQNAINTIPLKSTFTPIAILKKFPAKIAFDKLEDLPENEHRKAIVSMLWIFKQTDTERRNTECKNGCGHDWHNID